jgi:hypothetical protein
VAVNGSKVLRSEIERDEQRERVDREDGMSEKDEDERV